MRPDPARLLLVLSVILSHGCTIDLTGPDPKPPEVFGSWSLRVVDAGPNPFDSDPSAGTCTVGDFQITLIDGGPPQRGETRYSGTHTGFSMVCSGVNQPATQVFGMVDTVLVVEAGELSVRLLQIYEDTGWILGMTGADFSLQDLDATASGLDGTFSWTGNHDSPRVVGDFFGTR